MSPGYGPTWVTQTPGLAMELALCSQPHCSGLWTPSASSQSLARPPCCGLGGVIQMPRAERCSSSFSAPFDRIAEINFHIDADEDSVSLHSVFVGGGRTRQWVGNRGKGLLPGSSVPP